MIYEFTKPITCTDSFLCNQEILAKLENPNLKLHADNETDIVNGSLTIYHVKNLHEIKIQIYENDENPTSEHLSTLKRPNTIPTKAALKTAI